MKYQGNKERELGIKIKLHNNTTKKSADVQHIPGADMYKVYMYPGEEEWLPWVEFCKDKDEALEAAKKWIDDKESPQPS